MTLYHFKNDDGTGKVSSISGDKEELIETALESGFDEVAVLEEAETWKEEDL